ncbi:Hypothetical predicted protein [Cloeon dipterum]|uniref:Uncharacterized protein n=1 Tax=Cloeon dipterum TaxID=197152 RepID=A0A8S1E3K8_9INSE|nr:Hypothetical predicted protein [Cloeon dipterum]
MESATLVEKTKWRLNGQKKLKDWAMEAVQTNLHACTQIKGGSNIQLKLSPKLRDDVLQELQRRKHPVKTKTEEEYISMKKSVLVLMNTMTKTLDLDHLLSFHPNKFDSRLDFFEVLKMVSISAPNVRQLIINYENLTDCYKNDLIQNTYKDHLSSLKELRILKVVGFINNCLGIALLCEKLPNLQILSANEINLRNISEEEMKKSFGHLRLLECGVSTSTRNKIWKWLPHLDVVFDVRRIGLTLEDFLEDESVPRERKYINLVDYNWASNAWTDFSNIRYLECYGDEIRWNEYKKTLKLPTTLDALILTLTKNEEPVDGILLEYGANLRYLSLIGDDYQSVQLNHISELCPRLEFLSMKSVHVTGNATRQAKFSQLKEFVWQHEYLCTVESSISAVLSSSPNLRKLVLKGHSYSLFDLKQVKNLVIDKKVLGSLQTLHWEVSRFTKGSVFKELAGLMKIASANLAELRDLKLSLADGSSSFINIVETMRHDFCRYKYLMASNFRCCLIQAIMADKYLCKILNCYEQF